MSENEKGRNIRFPLELWDAIDADAKRCKRSSVKQMESVLSLYYRLSAGEVRQDVIEKMQQGSEVVIINTDKKVRKTA